MATNGAAIVLLAELSHPRLFAVSCGADEDGEPDANFDAADIGEGRALSGTNGHESKKEPAGRQPAGGFAANQKRKKLEELET